MTLISTCSICGYADGGHAPDCSVWVTTSEYDILLRQKNAILAKEKARGDALMQQLEGTLMGKLRQTEAERDQLRRDLASVVTRQRSEIDTLRAELEQARQDAADNGATVDRLRGELEAAKRDAYRANEALWELGE